jgi:hypothetical protein
VYHWGVDTKKELWDRLDGEPSRALEAFRTFLGLPGGERTLVAAYRQFVGNPDALKVSDTWIEWARRYAWNERTRAHDAHVDRIRRDAMDEAIEEEAAERARQAERQRNHLNELMALGYAQAMEYLEELDPSTMRFADVAQVIRLHMDALVKLDSIDERVRETDWDEEDDELIEGLLKAIEAEPDEKDLDEDEEKPDGESA